MSRSSIFSFETLRGPFPVPRGLLLCLALLLCVEFSVARRDWIWSRVPRSSTGVVDALETQVVAAASHPRIVLLGDSRTRDAVVPRLLEQELDLPEGSVLNLGLTAGVPFDSRTFYERNRDVLSQADVLVVDFEWRYFIDPPDLTARVRRYATLRDRVALFLGRDDLSASIAGWLWRTYDAGDALRQWAADPTVTDDTLPIAPDGRVVWRDEELDTGPASLDPTDYLQQVFRNPQPNDAHAKQLEQLIALAQSDGLTVVVVHWPFRDQFIAACRAEHPDQYNASFARLKKAAKPADASLLFEHASDVALPDDYFYDHQHVTRKGAETLTKALAERLREWL